MKRLLVLCAILFIGVWTNSKADNLDSLNQFTGWEYSGDIRTQKLKTAGYTYTQLMQNGKELFTADNAGYIRIWNLETGKLRYSKKINCERAIANYKNDILYYHWQDTLYGYNMQTDSILFKYRDQYLGYWDPYYSFHNSNKILIPKYKSRVVYDRTNSIDYTAYWFETKVFDCDSVSLTSSPKIPYADGYNFIYSKRNPNVFIYSDRDWAVSYYSWQSHDYDNYYSAAKNSTNAFVHEESAIQFKNAFSASERYVVSIYDSCLKFCDVTKRVDQPFETRLLDYKVKNNYVIDNKDRIVYVNEAGTELIAGCWAASVSSGSIPLNDTLGLTILTLNSDASAVIVAGKYGKMKYVPMNITLNTQSVIKAGVVADRTDINVGEQVDFTSTCTGMVTDFKILVSDGGTITDYGVKYIFKKAGDFDITVIAGDGINYDTIVYKNMIHVAPKFSPKLASYTEDRRFGYLPLTVKFQNITNKPYTFLEWNFGDSTTSNEENPTHSYYKYGKYVVTLTLISDGDTLSQSKDFNVVENQYQGGRFGEGSYYYSIPTVWVTNSFYDDLVGSGDDKFYYTEHVVDIVDGSSLYSRHSKSKLMFCDGMAVPFQIEEPDFSYRCFLFGGIVTNRGFVYNNKGRILYALDKTMPGKIVTDRYRDSIIIFDNNKLYYYDQYFKELWNHDYFELTNDSCTVLNVTSMYSGNIALYLYMKNANKVIRYEIDPESGQVIDNYGVACAINAQICHLSDDVYYSKIESNMVTFDKRGNVLNSVYIGGQSMHKLDSNLIMTINNNSDLLDYNFYDSNLNLLYSVHDTNMYINYYQEITPIMLKDRSIVVMKNLNLWNYSIFAIQRYFFPEIYQSDTTTSVPAPSTGERLVNTYPNPAHNEITISTKDEVDINNIEITDINGNMCSAAIKQRSDNSLVLDISKLSSGTYCYRIRANEKQIKGKFVKE